ncbi:myristoylated alanine-rich C-kinase substrate-like [Neofelis nebulosa]|uniref:myristoylated alanine-rich C-kinase substrate-like n=1 Tax=Neofelis nebulosa TaxID=61452 RepID=UPI00272B11BB|nr:myristoylated alanine-rich C-kinase substrate-like [Neofelis nebulosa]
MSTHQYQSLGDHVSPTFGTVDTTQGFKAQASARAEPLQSSGLLPRGGQQPSQSGPPPNIYPRGLGHWPSRPLKKAFPSVPGGGVGRSRDARPSPRAPHSSTHHTFPAALAHPGHPATRPWPHTGLRATSWGAEHSAEGAPAGSLTDSPCSGRAMTRGPSGRVDEYCRQREEGKKEEKAQARPLRGAARTTAVAAVAAAAAAAAAERAGRAPGGTCAQIAGPAPPLAPAHPVHWPDEPGGGSRVGGVARRPSRREEEPELEPVCLPNSSPPPAPLAPGARVFRSQHVELLGPGSLLPSRSAPGVAAHAHSLACSRTFHPLDLEAPSARPPAPRRVSRSLANSRAKPADLLAANLLAANRLLRGQDPSLPSFSYNFLESTQMVRSC